MVVPASLAPVSFGIENESLKILKVGGEAH
jgi:hypothetical protein